MQKSVDVQMTEKKMPMIIVMMTTMKLVMTMAATMMTTATMMRMAVHQSADNWDRDGWRPVAGAQGAQSCKSPFPHHGNILAVFKEMSKP